MSQLPKYSLRECTPEELSAFKKEFDELLLKHLIYFEPIPQFTRADASQPWTVGCNIVINKKLEIPAKEDSKSNDNSDSGSLNPATPA